MSRRLSLQRLPLRPRPQPALSLLIQDIAMATLRAADRYPRPQGATPSLAPFPASHAGIYQTELDYRTACYPEAREWAVSFLDAFVFTTVPETTTILTHIAAGELGRTLTGAEGRLLHSVVVDLLTTPRLAVATEEPWDVCLGCEHERQGVRAFRVTYRDDGGEHTEHQRYCHECEALIRANWPGTVVRVEAATGVGGFQPAPVRSTEVL